MDIISGLLNTQKKDTLATWNTHSKILGAVRGRLIRLKLHIPRKKTLIYYNRISFTL